jgi:hypothetical protein
MPTFPALLSKYVELNTCIQGLISRVYVHNPQVKQPQGETVKCCARFMVVTETSPTLVLQLVYVCRLQCGKAPGTNAIPITDPSEVVEVVIINLTDMPHPVHRHG